MATVIAEKSMSLDGFIADPSDAVAHIFDWYGSGRIEVPTATEGLTFNLTDASARFVARHDCPQFQNRPISTPLTALSRSASGATITGSEPPSSIVIRFSFGPASCITRRPVAVEEELARVVPVVQGLAAQTQVPLSLDTSKALVARAGLQAGAHIVNDVTALLQPWPMLVSLVTWPSESTSMRLL